MVSSSILLAIDAFASVDKLMNFVEQTIKNGVEKVSLTDERSKYQFFLNLNPVTSLSEVQEFIPILDSDFNVFKNVIINNF